MQSELRTLCEAVSRTDSIGDSVESDSLLSYLDSHEGSLKESLFVDLSKRLLSASFCEEAISLLRVLLCLWRSVSSSRRTMMTRIVFNTLKRFQDNEMERFVYDALASLNYEEDELPVVIENMKLAGLSVSPNGCKHRLRCIISIARNSNSSSAGPIIRGLCPEIVLYIHDQSSAVRSLALQVLNQFCTLAFPDISIIELIMTILIGGLAGISLDMRSGSITCLGLAISNLWDCLEHNSRHNIIKTVFSFSVKDANNSQLVRSSIRFIRFVLRRISPATRGGNLDKEQVELLRLCCAYYGSELLVSRAAQTACRVAMRRLTTKLGKKLGWECLRKDFVPQEHWALIRYAERFANREIAQRRKTAERNKLDEPSSDEEEEEALVSKLHYKPLESTIPTDDIKKMIIRPVDEGKPTSPLVRKNLSNLADLRSSKSAMRSKPARNERQHDIIGLDTRSSKHRGDAKRKGKMLDPFAYVRLNPSLSKEKHKRSAVKSFKKILTISKKPAKRART